MYKWQCYKYILSSSWYGVTYWYKSTCQLLVSGDLSSKMPPIKGQILQYSEAEMKQALQDVSNGLPDATVAKNMVYQEQHCYIS